MQASEHESQYPAVGAGSVLPNVTTAEAAGAKQQSASAISPPVSTQLRLRPTLRSIDRVGARRKVDPGRSPAEPWRAGLHSGTVARCARSASSRA